MFDSLLAKTIFLIQIFSFEAYTQKNVKLFLKKNFVNMNL